MDQILTRIEKFKKDNNIGRLEYNWGGDLWRVIGEVADSDFGHLSGEDFTQKLFLKFHDKITDAIQKQDENELVKTIQLIVGEWGGIHFDDDSETIQNYVEWLLDYDGNYSYNDNDLLPHHWNGISSWSKILAALKPEDYFIYDSRVAVVLQILFGQAKRIYLPPSQAKGTKTLIQKIKTKQNGKDKVKYTNYCAILKNTGSGFHLEKELFMLGGYLSQLSVEQQQSIVDKYLS